MADKILNTRILLKYDTYENWTTNNPVLKAGEIAIATVPSNQDGVQNAPSVLMKVGDGTTDYKNLKFVSGLAADVYGWAKAEKKPTYEASEITGISTYIADYVQEEMGISVDTDTQYQIVKVDDYNYKLQSKGKGDSAWADVENSTIVIPNDTAAIQALQALVGEESVATQIGNAITALDLANTYEAKGEAAKVQTALDEYKTENDAAVKKVSDDLAAEVIAARAAEKANSDAIAAIKDDANIDSFADVVAELAKKQNTGDYATKTEAQGYADAKDEAIAAAKKAGDDAQADVDALETLVGVIPEGATASTVVGYIEEKTANIASDATVSAIGDRVTALEGLVGEDSVATQISTAVAAEAEIARAAEKANADAIDAIEADYLKEADKTELQGNIDSLANGAVKANTEAIATLNGNAETEGSVDYKIAQKFSTLMENPDEAMNSIQELVDWTTEHAADALEMSNQVTANKNAIATLNGDASTAGSVDKKIADAIAAENLGQYATDSELSELAGRVTTAEGEIDTLQSDLDTAEAAITALETKVGDEAVGDQISAAIEALNIGDYAKAADLTAAINQHNTDKAALEASIATKANDADLAAVAKSGLIDDISIGEGTTLIFDCGDSTNC